MKSMYKNLFQPITIKNMTVRNRIVMPPMGTNYGEHNGEMSFLHIDYYELRAKGGTGLIIVENASIDSPLGSNGTTQLRIDHDNYMPRLYKLCETVHKHGASIAIQINHAGASAKESRIGMQPVSASDIPSKAGGDIPRPLTEEEIGQIVKKYGEAAKRAMTAGFDAVEIHAGHSYLISQFISPLTNKRTDRFGGSAENRLRFAVMVLAEVRKQVGENFPVFVRISADEMLEGGNTLEDCLNYLTYIERYVDVFDVSTGLNDSLQFQIDANYLPDGWRSYMARQVRERYGKPVITTGNIRNPQIADEIIEKGDADFIGIGRGLIADPNWAAKAQRDAADDIRKCISCNIGCAGHRIGINRPIRCTVNPSVNEEESYLEQTVEHSCNVVVIGGGTAGLEAACTAAEVGCTVFVLEKQPYLGGLAAEISKIPDKSRLRDFPEYLIHRAGKLKNLYALTDTEATIPFIKMLKPDIIVNATGSNPLLPPIQGLHKQLLAADSHVFTITDMINNLAGYPADMSGKKVAVIGGGAVGLDVVEYFSPRGAETTIVEMQPEIGRDLDPVSRVGIFTLMKQHGVRQLVNTRLMEVKKNSFLIDGPDGAEELDFDYGFICLGMRANAPIYNELLEAFADDNTDIINIGDSVRARRIMEGVQEGRNILNVLVKNGFLKN